MAEEKTTEVQEKDITKVLDEVQDAEAREAQQEIKFSELDATAVKNSIDTVAADAKMASVLEEALQEDTKKSIDKVIETIDVSYIKEEILEADEKKADEKSDNVIVTGSKKKRKLKTFGEKVMFDTVDSLTKKEAIELNSYMANGTIKTAKLTSVAYFSKESRMLAGIVETDYHDILIPYSQLVPDPEEVVRAYKRRKPDATETEIENYKKLDIEKRFGSEINFVIKDKVEGGMYIASRVEALNRTAYQYYVPKGKKKARIEVGDAVQARVVKVEESCVTVEAWGIEIRIPARDCSWFRIGDCQEEFKLNMIVPIVIKNIDVVSDNKKMAISVQASIKEYEDDPRAKNIEHYKKVKSTQGIVTGILESGHIFVRLGRNKNKMMDCMCYPAKKFVPPIGAVVDVEIDPEKGIDMERFFIYGRYKKTDRLKADEFR